MRKVRSTAWLVAVIAVGLSFGLATLKAADSPETVEKMMRRRRMQQLSNARVDRHHLMERWGYDDIPPIVRAGEGGRGEAVNVPAVVTPLFGAAGAPPPDPPNSIAIANTSYDLQQGVAQGYQVGRLAGADIVHFTWVSWDKIPFPGESDYFVNYGSYTISTQALNQGYGGTSVSLGVHANANRPSGEVDYDNCWHAAFYQRAEAASPYTSWHLYFPSPGSAMHIDDELVAPQNGGAIYPRMSISKNAAPSPDIYHEVAEGANHMMVYWRYNGTVWQGPVQIDQDWRLSYTLAADPNSQKVAIAFLTGPAPPPPKVLNVAYYESQTEGAGWINGNELGPANKHTITNYINPKGPSAWGHTSTRYDRSGYLHIVWDEQRFEDVFHGGPAGSDAAIRHWSDSAFQIRPVAFGYWDSEARTGAWDLHLAKLSMGIGSGGTLCQGGAQSNKNYVYVVFTQFGGLDAASQADYSALGYYNGELYLSVSNSSGRTWAPAVNITNTKTPGCNPGATPPGQINPPRPNDVCRSEHWATIGPEVNDIDIVFIEDNDAGAAQLGEGTHQINRVMYMRLPGGTKKTNAQYVCPVIAANYAAFLTAIPECEYHAKRGQVNNETMTIINLGNASMNGNISKVVGASWLTMTTGGAYTINAGDPDKIVAVAMSAVGITTEGLYQDTIRVTHNAPNVTSPQNYPIDFFIVDDFFCPQDENLKTGVASPGSLALDVRSNARFASQDDEGGLWRYVDSSFSIFDASLLVAHGPQAVGDTTVFHRFYDRFDPGQYGFRAVGNLKIDTAKYSTGNGYARACARMVTSDSLVGVAVEWIFPQDADSDEFVLARYTFFSHFGPVSITSPTIDNLVAGVLADLDVVPAARYSTVQSGVENQNGGDLLQGLIWQQGTDTAGSVPWPPLYTAERYRGGIRYIGPGNLIGAQVGNNVQDIQPGGGPKSEWLYRTLVALSGINTPSLPDTDMYSIMTLAEGVQLGNPRRALQVVVALVSDTLDQTSFLARANQARAYATAIGLVSGATNFCHGDPQCDGVSSVQDVVLTIDVAFRGVAPRFDPGFKYERTDVDCSGFSTVQDVVKVVNVAFRGGTVQSNFCFPLCVQ